VRLNALGRIAWVEIGLLGTLGITGQELQHKSAGAPVLAGSVGAHRDRLIGSTDRQAEADGVRPGRRAAVPSWDEIVFGTRRKKQD